MNPENGTGSSIFGCFVNRSSVHWDDDQKVKDAVAEQGELFCTYIWGNNGLCETLKKLDCSNYGTDLKIILFQFYVSPIPYLLDKMKEIGNYRKKEKSIGIPVIVNNDNFFSKQEEERWLFLKSAIFQKLSLLEVVIKKKKLDTNIEQIKRDIHALLI